MNELKSLMRLGGMLLFFAFMYFIASIAAHAADFDYYPPSRPPAVVVEPPPVIVAPSEPRCRTVRETKHDDILDTNDYIEREECD